MKVRSQSVPLVAAGVAIALATAGGALAAAGDGHRAIAQAPTLDSAATAGAGLARLHSLLVSHRGAVVLERYYNGTRPSRPANVKSVSKSVISALVGIAHARGHITSLEQPIGEFFPELADDPDKRAIRIVDLLTMQAGLESTSGRNYGAWVQSRNWVRDALRRPLLSPPGTRVDYSTGNSHLLSALLTRATKKSTWEFAQETLAKPLGFSLARWPQDPQGVYFGGNDMLMTPRQMLAFGELYLRRGRVGGIEVMPGQYVDASFVPRGQSRWGSDRYYGYGWWIRQFDGHPAFYAWGYGGQFIFVVPTLDLVVTTTSVSTPSADRRGHNRSIYELVEREIVRVIGEGG